jgi:hypothetical protein
VDDYLVHNIVNDYRVYCGFNGLYKIDKKIGESANEYVSEQNGIKLCEFDITKVRIKYKQWKLR